MRRKGGNRGDSALQFFMGGLLTMYTPAEVASNVIGIGRTKASLKIYQMLMLGFLAGMFIALAAVGCNTISCSIHIGG